MTTETFTTYISGTLVNGVFTPASHFTGSYTITIPDGGITINSSVLLNGTVPGTYLGYYLDNGQQIPLILSTSNNVHYLFGESSTSQTYAITQSTFTQCFAPGTNISTVDGDRAIEDLSIGDLVLTLSGAARPVRWIGRSHVNVAAHPYPHEVNPIIVRAGAFGPHLPVRDLTMSPEHAVYIEGALIPIKALIDGKQVAQQSVDRCTYFHILLDEHEVILAEDLPCETLLGVDDSMDFENIDSAPESLAFLAPYAPRITQGPAVEAARARISLRTDEFA